MPGLIDRKIDSAPASPPAMPSGSAPLSIDAQRDALYAAAVRSTNLAFLTVDAGGTITSWNPGAEQVFGYSAEEAIGQNIETTFPADRRDETALMLGIFQTRERIANFATVRLRKGGRQVHVVIDISPLLSGAKELIGLSQIIREVTEQRRAEELFGLAAEASPSGIIMIDRSGHIVMVNSRIERLFGYRRSELLGQPIEILVPHDLRESYEEMRAEITRDAQCRDRSETRHLFGLSKDGHEIPVAVDLSPIGARDGPLILAAVVDIRERNRIERRKDELVSTVSHELRTPLTSIDASLTLLLAGRAGKLPPSARRLVTIAHSNGQRLVRLVNDILDIEKIESGKMVFDLNRVSAREVVEQAIEASRAYADRFEVRVRLASESVTGDVRADADRLAQVVTNLMSNAIKFSPQGEEVILAVVERDGVVRITVRDHGPGIPEEFKSRAFEKFAQADTNDTRQKPGTGLGLSIVKQIAERLGGRAGFESAAGYGSLFYVELPS